MCMENNIRRNGIFNLLCIRLAPFKKHSKTDTYKQKYHHTNDRNIYNRFVYGISEASNISLNDKLIFS